MTAPDPAARRSVRSCFPVQVAAREELVEQLRRSAASLDPVVLNAIGQVPRERFAPRHARSEAYDDKPLPIGLGQTLSQPTMVAWMTSLLLPLAGSERTLEIGTGSGYQTAILSLLLPRSRIVTMERHPRHARRDRRRLQAPGAVNVEVVIGDGTLGYSPGAPYDWILVTAGAPPDVPGALIVQLVPEGRMVVPAGPRDRQELLLIVKDERRRVTMLSQGECSFVPLIGRQGWESGEEKSSDFPP